jgi:hypothetical protein
MASKPTYAILIRVPYFTRQVAKRLAKDDNISVTALLHKLIWAESDRRGNGAAKESK